MNELESLRRKWLQERPEYERLGVELASEMRTKLRRAGIWADVGSRAKEISSLIRKVIKKPHHTYELIGDKSGVRVILRHKHELDTALNIAREVFECSQPDYKCEALKTDRVGYLGIHVDVMFREADRIKLNFAEGLRAELQIRTLAQHLWSEMSHDSFYKNDETLNPLPDKIKRRIFLLAGLVELADDEFSRVNTDMPTNSEVLLLKSLERHHFKLTTRRGDPELSLNAIRLLAPLYQQDPSQIEAHLDEFYESHADVLLDVYENANASGFQASAFLDQPEVLMIYDLLAADQLAVRTVWNSLYPEDELERIANVFGISFD